MKAILGRKIGMSQLFSSNGKAVPVTVVSAAPNQVALRRNEEKDGRRAVQLELHGAGSKEFALEMDKDVKELTVEQFKPGDVVEVKGISKGKGLAGVIKRHGFSGAPASHGHRHVRRSAGSIGSAFPQHVMKGKKMAGRMGRSRVTVKNLKIAWVDREKNLLAVKGAVPGRRGSMVQVVGR